MKEIVCDLDPFIYHQKIYLVDTDTGETKLLGTYTYDEIKDINVIMAIAAKEQVFNFHLFGDTNFIQNIGDELTKQNPLDYSIQEISVKYN